MKKIALMAIAALALAGCGGGDVAGVAVAPPRAAAALDAPGWERIVPGGDCQCSDSSEFSFWVRKAHPRKVLLYLQDGGACFDAKTCARDSGVYQTRVEEGPVGEGGIFDLADERNPFADYSVVYVPYCTGDVHIGDTTANYGGDLTVQHRGYVNGTAALDRLVEQFPDATEVVVIGESAGSIAAPLYAGLASDRLPRARVTAIADGSGSYPDVPRLREIVTGWGASKRWSFPGLFIRTGRRNPDVVLARHDFAYDDHQAMWFPLAGIPEDDLLSLMDANETQIEDAGVNQVSYVAPGTEHTALSEDGFYTEEVGGQQLLEWVTKLVEGEPVADVRCKECR